ncbi:MAG: sensor histidine kinase [Candidatus Rifleibacteriota bacterium]
MTEDNNQFKPVPTQQKLEMLGSLISGIAHEINTPLHYLGTNLTFLKSAFKDLLDLVNEYQSVLAELEEEGKIPSDALSRMKNTENEANPDYLKSEISQALQESEEGIAMASGLVLAMKDFSYPGPRNFSLVDVNQCVDTVYKISRFAWKKEADFELNLADDLPYLLASRDELHQVLINLIVNASQAIKEKRNAGDYDRGQINVSTRSENNQIVIEVANDGPLIAQENLTRIFEPHFTTKPAGHGTGLGLSLVKKVVEKEHGGKIEVTSNAQFGTIFRIFLPHRQSAGIQE